MTMQQPAGSAGRALVHFSDPALVQRVSTLVARAGFLVDKLDDGEEKILKLQQGDFDLVATSSNGAPESQVVVNNVNRLPMEVRRRLFLVLVGDQFKSGDSTQAFVTRSDLVLKGDDVESAGRLLTFTLEERRRLYQSFLDAETRQAEGKL